MTAANIFRPITTHEAMDVLRNVHDPEFKASIVDLGLIYGINISDDGIVTVRMTLTSPGCPYAEMIVSTVILMLEAQKSVTEAKIEMVWEPAWTTDRMSPNLRYEHDMDFW